MENLIIDKVKNMKNLMFSPGIQCNANTGYCVIDGESYMEDTLTFYYKVHTWLEEFFRSRKEICLDIKLTYFNTSSSRSILDLLVALKTYGESGAKVTVNWFYDPGNKIAMQQEVEDFEDEAEIKINFLALPEN